MTSTRIPARLRAQILARDAARCAFCRCAEDLMGVAFEIDHVTPRSAGGATVLANLCLCCPTCNRHKASRTLIADPAGGASVPLFHPVRDAWSEHFEWCDGATRIAGRTAIGRATIEALRINRPVMIELRRYWAATGRHPPPLVTG